MEQDRASVIWYSRSGHCRIWLYHVTPYSRKAAAFSPKYLQGTSLCTFLPDLAHQKVTRGLSSGVLRGRYWTTVIPPTNSFERPIPVTSFKTGQLRFHDLILPPPPATPGQEDCDNVALSKARALLHHHPLSPHPVALFVAMLPTVEKAPGVSLLSRIPSAAYVLNWIFFSTIVIIFNKKIISSWGF
ncbi:hypothetical protein V492_02247, partial [Pseudogymnoascus sp. VKM F-4246]